MIKKSKGRKELVNALENYPNIDFCFWRKKRERKCNLPLRHGKTKLLFEKTWLLCHFGILRNNRKRPLFTGLFTGDIICEQLLLFIITAIIAVLRINIIFVIFVCYFDKTRDRQNVRSYADHFWYILLLSFYFVFV